MSDIVLSPAQQEAVDKIIAWSETPHEPRFVLGGFAGTGKTTLIRALHDAFGTVCVCPTGKAYPFHMNLITFGRQICNARKPKCDQCSLTGNCLYFKGKL